MELLSHTIGINQSLILFFTYVQLCDSVIIYSSNSLSAPLQFPFTAVREELATWSASAVVSVHWNARSSWSHLGWLVWLSYPFPSGLILSDVAWFHLHRYKICVVIDMPEPSPIKAFFTFFFIATKFHTKEQHVFLIGQWTWCLTLRGIDL